jgi:hypothetical protein
LLPVFHHSTSGEPNYTLSDCRDGWIVSDDDKR